MSRFELRMQPSIMVVGVGSGGCNAVSRIDRRQIPGVDFLAVDTDVQALSRLKSDPWLLIGENVTRGLGTGGHVGRGLLAAEESRADLRGRFGDRCREAVMHYVRRFRGASPGPVFRNSLHDLPLQNNGVKQMLRRLGRQTGMLKVHAHRFRHTFATWAIENQARELDVQYLLGHSTPDMVRRYSATYNSEKAARAHEAFSPADRLGERLAAGARAIRLA